MQTSDFCSQYTANLLIDYLNAEIPRKSYLISYKQLDITNTVQ